MAPNDCKVALLAGGSSGERDISLASAEGAGEALKEAGYEVTFIDPADKDDLKKLMDEDFDVAFLCMHGKGGEDGTLQGMLEILGIPYTCSGVQASAIAMDKNTSKILYRNSNIPTPKSISLEAGESITAQEVVEQLGLPCVVKPATEGSALGVAIVDTLEGIEKAMEEVWAIDKKMTIESFVKGTETTVAILGNDDPTALPVIEIVPTGEFYDFDSKYAPGGSKHLCPAPLNDDITAKLQHYAIEAHKALGCSGVSRSDFIVDEQGNPWILETNTIPGMTATSLLPDAARAAGMTFPQLCTALINFALER